MPGEPMKRRCPVWAALVVGWGVESLVAWGQWHDAWRPELLLVIVTCLALRSTRRASLLWSIAAGWLMTALTPGHSWWLLTFWAALGAALSWLRTQWDTERLTLAIVMSWMAVMAWHGLTWLVRWGDEGAPRPWDATFVVVQTGLTVVCTIAWWRYAPRWVHHAS